MDILRILKKTFMALLVAGLLLTIPAWVFTFSIQNVLLDSNTYTSAFEKSGFYDKAYDWINRRATPESPQTRALVGQLFPKEYAKKEVDRLLQSVLAYVKGESTTLNLTVYPRKTQLAEKLLLTEEQKKVVLAAIPDTIDLNVVLRLAPLLEQTRSAVSLLNTVMVSMAGVIIVVLLILAFLAGNLKNALRWVGFPLFVSSLFCVLLMWVGQAQASSYLAKFLPAEQLGQGFFGAAANAAVIILEIMASRVYTVAAVPLLTGAIFLVGSFFMKSQQSNTATESRRDPSK